MINKEDILFIKNNPNTVKILEIIGHMRYATIPEIGRHFNYTNIELSQMLYDENARIYWNNCKRYDNNYGMYLNGRGARLIEYYENERFNNYMRTRKK